MYQPPHFVESRLAVQHALIRAHPLGLLVTAWMAYFFRDPPRVTPLGDGIVISPADVGENPASTSPRARAAATAW